jgi:hypothetical protein
MFLTIRGYPNNLREEAGYSLFSMRGRGDVGHS